MTSLASAVILKKKQQESLQGRFCSSIRIFCFTKYIIDSKHSRHSSFKHRFYILVLATTVLFKLLYFMRLSKTDTSFSNPFFSLLFVSPSFRQLMQVYLASFGRMHSVDLWFFTASHTINAHITVGLCMMEILASSITLYVSCWWSWCFYLVH